MARPRVSSTLGSIHPTKRGECHRSGWPARKLAAPPRRARIAVFTFGMMWRALGYTTSMSTDGASRSARGLEGARRPQQLVQEHRDAVGTEDVFEGREDRGVWRHSFLHRGEVHVERQVDRVPDGPHRELDRHEAQLLDGARAAHAAVAREVH